MAYDLLYNVLQIIFLDYHLLFILIHPDSVLGLCLMPRNCTPVIWDHHPENAPSLTSWRMNGAFLAMSAPILCISWWSTLVKRPVISAMTDVGGVPEAGKCWELTAVEAVCEIPAQTQGTVGAAVVAGGLQQPQVLTQMGHLSLSLQYLCFCVKIDILANNRASSTLSPTYFQHPSPPSFLK